MSSQGSSAGGAPDWARLGLTLNQNTASAMTEAAVQLSQVTMVDVSQAAQTMADTMNGFSAKWSWIVDAEAGPKPSSPFRASWPPERFAFEPVQHAVATLREDLPEDPVTAIAEYVDRADAMAATLERHLQLAVEDGRGSTPDLEIRVRYVIEGDDLRVTARAHTQTHRNYHLSYSPSSPAVTGLVEVRMVERSAQRSSLVDLITRIAVELREGRPQRFRILRPDAPRMNDPGFSLGA